MFYHNKIVNKLKEFGKAQEGLAYIEFALSITILMMLFLGAVELTRAFLIIQKIEKTVSTLADVVAQTDPNSTPVTSTQMSQLMSAVDDMMNPYSSGMTDTRILAIVTSVTKTGVANPVINWQYCGGGGLSVTSKLGKTIGGTATLPSGFTMNSGEEAIIGEVFYNFTPIIASNNIIGSFQIYRYSIFMPRLGALTAFSSNCP